MTLRARTARAQSARLKSLGLALALSGAVAMPALAQDQAATPAPAQQGSSSSWIKVCEKEQATGKDVCIVTQEIRGPNGQFLATAGVRTYKDDTSKVALVFGFPLGMLLQPGVRYQIDQNEQKAGQFGICLPTGCFAEIQSDLAAINALKKGNELVLLAISGRGETVPFRMSLSGFTKTFDGPPIDPKVLAESQQKLQAEIQRRAEERRKQLESQKPADSQ